MKLSEAIRLGSTILTPQAGGQHFAETQSGCALGMAAIARGCTFHVVPGPVIATERRTLGVEGVWGEWILSPVSRPCNCWRVRVPREMRIKDIIAHLFDHHVMRKNNWTLERLVAWVETVEPKPSFKFEPPRVMSLETLHILAQMRQVQQGFSGIESRVQKQEDPELWQARIAAFLANHAKQRTAVRAAAMAVEISAGEKKSAYQRGSPMRGNLDGTGATPAVAALFRG
jgi:hypothetical protein